jgi:hypothetical protein
MKKEVQNLIISFIFGTVGFFIIIGFCLVFAGCQEQNTAKVWGQGDPDPNHIKYFGNDNLSRLCFVQTQTINKQAKLISEFIALNAKQHKIMGEKDIDLYDRVRKLEDPNGPKENKTPN